MGMGMENDPESISDIAAGVEVKDGMVRAVAGFLILVGAASRNKISKPRLNHATRSTRGRPPRAVLHVGSPLEAVAARETTVPGTRNPASNDTRPQLTRSSPPTTPSRALLVSSKSDKKT